MQRSRPAPRPADVDGDHDGRPYLLWLPDRLPPPWPAMVIVHGAGSRKENHGDFARACAAAGWAALAYDQRGHGASRDEMGAEAVADAARMAALLAGMERVDERRVCIRGSSLGGYVAIHAAAGSPALRGAIAICPAGEEHLLRGLRSGELEMRAGPEARGALAAWLRSHDLRRAVELMGEKPLLLLHARGDERIPCEWSRELVGHAAEPSRLIVVPGGHHRSLQHDSELHGVALRWLEGRLAEGTPPPG